MKGAICVDVFERRRDPPPTAATSSCLSLVTGLEMVRVVADWRDESRRRLQDKCHGIYSQSQRIEICYPWATGQSSPSIVSGDQTSLPR